MQIITNVTLIFASFSIGFSLFLYFQNKYNEFHNNCVTAKKVDTFNSYEFYYCGILLPKIKVIHAYYSENDYKKIKIGIFNNLKEAEIYIKLLL